jgi:pilus assembly protein Flp/PilA
LPYDTAVIGQADAARLDSVHSWDVQGRLASTPAQGIAMSLPANEDGQGLVEYALILVLVAIVAIAILALLGPQIGNVFSQITWVLDNPMGGFGAYPPP